jgi:hypothetical protein
MTEPDTDTEVACPFFREGADECDESCPSRIIKDNVGKPCIVIIDTPQPARPDGAEILKRLHVLLMDNGEDEWEPEHFQKEVNNLYNEFVTQEIHDAIVAPQPARPGDKEEK